jgi:amino-acid N-acetyltransferase
VVIYAFFVHNHSTSAGALSLGTWPAPEDRLIPVVRSATRGDVDQIHDLVTGYVAEGLMLPRTAEQIALNIDSYVVAVSGGRVVACAALEEYSPSLAEVSSVAVARGEHGNGLGTQVVLGVERLARSRDIDEIFALSLTDNFFLALGYAPTAIARYPEKLSRYEMLANGGLDIVPKRCFQKVLGNQWELPQLVETSAREPALRAS